LASRYATALFELADEQGALDAVAGDLATVEAMLGESAALREAMRSPVVSRKSQAAAVTAIAERAGLGSQTRNFLGVLAGNRRLFALPGIIRAFQAMLATRRGEVTAEVTSAVPLDEAQVAALRQSVSRYAGKAVQLRTEVDPRLLGGLVVRIGSRMVDASLRTKLQQLELAMKGVG
jgi:F-type H+-transporting ATPase subunit delta